MACPACGCKETHTYVEDDHAPAGDLERCAACHVIFDVEEHTPEEDDE